jgi:YfiR/HmsC-like
MVGSSACAGQWRSDLMTRMRLSRYLLKFYAFGVVVLALFVLVKPIQAIAQAQAPEADLKAAIITNMLLFVEWPTRESPPSEHLTVCFLGDSPVAAALTRLDGKVIKGKLLKIIQFNSSSIAECQALYFSPGNVASLGSVLTSIGSSSVFLAADSPEYSRRGIMLNLERVSGRIVFDVDLGSAQKAGLQVSSKALRLARQVIE